MKLVGGAKIPFSVKCFLYNFSECQNSNFNFYIYTLFFYHFCVFIVMIQWNLCKLGGTEMLLTYDFGHNVKQLSSWLHHMINWRSSG